MKKGTFNDPKNPREHLSYKELLAKTVRETKSYGEVILLDMQVKSNDGNSDGLSVSGYDLGESTARNMEISGSGSHSEEHSSSLTIESRGIAVRTVTSEVRTHEFAGSSTETEFSLNESLLSAGSGRMDMSELSSSIGGAMEDRRQGFISLILN